MNALALVLGLVYLALAFGLRSVVQRRRTGSTGFRGISGRPGSAEWLGGALFVVALVVSVAAPVLAAAGVVPPVDALTATWAGLAGAVVAVGGIGLSLAAQHAMGASWRVGVEGTERTDLVTSGPFARVRNPFFTATLAVAGGVVLMVPSVVAITGFAALLTAVELQVRVVEEPYLLRMQGEPYRAYAATTGRFVPGVGRST